MNIGGVGFSPAGFNYSSRKPEGSPAPGEGRVASKETQAGGLSREDAAVVAELKKTDQAVRQHEMAHMAAGGGLITSGASYTYVRGPDGQNYAVAGEVGIDTSPGRTPEETISKAQRIRAAALAPADPSSQDRAVAAQATQMEQQARMEIASQSNGEGGNSSNDAVTQRLQSSYGASSASRPGIGLDTYA